MSNSNLPNYIGRDEQLRAIFESIEGAKEKGDFLSLVGPGGHGKSKILSEVQQEYSENDAVYILNFNFHSGLTNIRHFSEEFQRKWQKQVPQSVSARMMTRAVSVLQSQRLNKFIDLISTGGSVVAPEFSLLSLSKYALPENEGKSLASTYSDLLTQFLNQFYELNQNTRLLLLFDEYHRIPEEEKEEFDRMFHSLATQLPQGVVIIVASRTRNLCENYNSPIQEIELGEFTESEVAEYLKEAGFSPTERQISTSHEKTFGNPYYLERFTLSANEHGIQNALNRLPETEIRSYLDDAFLNQLEESQEQFLRDICALDEFRQDIVCELTRMSTSNIRRKLQNLYRKSVLEKIGTHNSVPVYRPHDFLQNHLRNTAKKDKLNQQHRICASIYLKQLDRKIIEGTVQDFLWALAFEESPNSRPIKSFAEETAKYFAIGSMLDYHLQEVDSDATMEQEIRELIHDPNIDESQVLNNLRIYYSDHDDVDISMLHEEIVSENQQLDIQVIDTEASSPEEELVVVASRCLQIFAKDDDEVDIEEAITDLQNKKEKIHQLTKSSSLNIVSGWVHILLLTTLSHLHAVIDQNGESDRMEEEVSLFIKNHFNLNRDDRIFIKQISKALENQFKEPKDIISKQPQDMVDKAMLERGAFGGIQEGFSDVIQTFVQDFYQARSSNSTIAYDRQLVEDAVREVAIYFNTKGNTTLAAITRDIGEVFSAFLSDEVIEQEDMLKAFTNTEAHRQIEQVFAEIES